ncbi:NAD(P)/FAD-dependent oxidoreductase [Palleronia caenipelagi]|nr:FAD-dependent oxidoreductase [Palleronia caenipelagi]
MNNIAVIGAGMAGLAAARHLADAGRQVVVFEKSRGTGGRLATRRRSEAMFDHGAPIAQGCSDFDATMCALSADRIGAGWRGSPGMSALLKPWVDGLDLRHEQQVTAVDHLRDGWHLTIADHGGAGPFDAVVIAIPAPQAQKLMPHPALEKVMMRPAWSLLAIWPELTLPKPSAPFEVIVDMSSHPNGTVGAIVAHCNEAFSRSHLEDTPDQICSLLVQRLQQLTGCTVMPRFAQAHRWRYARTTDPLGQPFIDAGYGCFIGGDWALGSHAGDAWRSGLALAEALTAGG